MNIDMFKIYPLTYAQIGLVVGIGNRDLYQGC